MPPFQKYTLLNVILSCVFLTVRNIIFHMFYHHFYLCDLPIHISSSLIFRVVYLFFFICKIFLLLYETNIFICRYFSLNLPFIFTYGFFRIIILKFAYREYCQNFPLCFLLLWLKKSFSNLFMIFKISVVSVFISSPNLLFQVCFCSFEMYACICFFPL